MSTVKALRQLFQLTQAGLAEELGCTQGNVWQYERTDKPQTVPPDVAMKLIAVAKKRGLLLTMDHVYGLVELPKPTSGMTVQHLLAAIGGQAAIARECDISDEAVSQWVCGDHLPKAREKYLRLAHPGPHWDQWDAHQAAKARSTGTQPESST